MTLVQRASKIEMEEINTEFYNFVDRLGQFQENLDGGEPYSQEYMSFLSWFEDEYKGLQRKNNEKNIISVSHKRLMKLEKK